jgi:hypothetical protein
VTGVARIALPNNFENRKLVIAGRFIASDFRARIT